MQMTEELSLQYQREGNKKMKDLYVVMDEMLMVESELQALETVTAVMKEGCKIKENQEMEDMLYVIEKYLLCVTKDLRSSIHNLDEFLAERKKD